MSGLFNREWFPVTHPFVLYFGQISGAMIKTFVLFRLDRQKWTRHYRRTSLAHRDERIDIASAAVDGRVRGLQRAAVVAAKGSGLSWGAIGAQLGVTRQGARQRYERLIDT